MRDIHGTRIAFVINAPGAADPPLDHPVRGDRTGTRPADMDIGTILHLQVPALYPSRTTDIAFELLRSPFDQHVTRTARPDMQFIGRQFPFYPAAARIVDRQRCALKPVFTLDPARA